MWDGDGWELTGFEAVDFDIVAFGGVAFADDGGRVAAGLRLCGCRGHLCDLLRHEALIGGR